MHASRDTREVGMPRPLFPYFAEKSTRDLRLTRPMIRAIFDCRAPLPPNMYALIHAGGDAGGHD